MRNWKEIVEARESSIMMINENGKKIFKKGHSYWKNELSKLTDYNELLDLFNYLSERLKKDIEKYYKKGNKAAGRRARKYAQRIKDTMTQIRNIIQNNQSK